VEANFRFWSEYFPTLGVGDASPFVVGRLGSGCCSRGCCCCFFFFGESGDFALETARSFFLSPTGDLPCFGGRIKLLDLLGEVVPGFCDSDSCSCFFFFGDSGDFALETARSFFLSPTGDLTWFGGRIKLLDLLGEVVADFCGSGCCSCFFFFGDSGDVTIETARSFFLSPTGDLTWFGGRIKLLDLVGTVVVAGEEKPSPES